MKNRQQGSAHAVIVIVLVLALFTALGWIFYQNFILKEQVKTETDLIVVNKDKTVDNAHFLKEKIVKRFDFTDADSTKKSLVLYTESTGGEVDIYIAPSDLSRTNSVKVDAEDGPGRGNISMEVSPGKTKKYLILFEEGPGEGNTIINIDQDGKTTSFQDQLDYAKLAKSYGQIGFWDFEKWLSDTTYTVTSSTGSGASLRLTVDVTDGSVKGPVKY